MRNCDHTSPRSWLGHSTGCRSASSGPWKGCGTDHLSFLLKEAEAIVNATMEGSSAQRKQKS
ncbi:MAG: hypothetical protein OJF47_000877 [Nitrospira sp.]|nr:MAG: hypothetical protein OJF47_000877 [Nitrospira sp.]